MDACFFRNHVLSNICERTTTDNQDRLTTQDPELIHGFAEREHRVHVLPILLDDTAVECRLDAMMREVCINLVDIQAIDVVVDKGQDALVLFV